MKKNGPIESRMYIFTALGAPTGSRGLPSPVFLRIVSSVQNHSGGVAVLSTCPVKWTKAWSPTQE